MAGTITDADVRFKVSFNLNNSPMDMSFEDLNMPTAYSDDTLVKGWIKVIDPAGTVIYKSTGYDAENLADPDIDGTASPQVWEISGIGLTLANGFPIEGTYTFIYKIDIDSGAGTATITKTYDYKITYPTASLNTVLNCLASQLTISDITDYIITDNSGNSIDADSKTLSWKISTNATNYTASYITAGNVSPFTIGSGSSYNSGKNLYVGDYKVVLTSTIQYVLEQWGSTDWFFVNYEIIDSDTSEVSCGSCLCSYTSCIASIETRYTTAIANNEPMAQINYYKDLKREITWAYVNYILAQSCDGDTSVWCDKLRSLIDSSEDCCDSVAEVNEEIVPIAGGVSGGGGSTDFAFTFGTGSGGLPTPSTSVHIHIFTTTSGSYTDGDVYEYRDGSWSYVDNWTGAAGSTGSNISVLENDQTGSDDSITGTSPDKLKTYTIAGGELSNNGTYIDIEAYINVVASKDIKLRIEFGGDVIVEHAIFTSGETNLILKARITRTGASLQKAIGTTTIVGIPDATMTTGIVSPTATLASDNDIDIIVEKQASYAPPICTCEYLIVTKQSKA